ncbi:MAG TPA: substrate-binding domain-containing protein, partial [Candidatus Binataceae bacterium]|nr:substrate-binding domain-containing protein [Candidatus Binataceae bacterium]
GGVLEHAAGRRARVAAFRTQQEIDATLLIAGCDPAVTILADWMGRHRPATTLTPVTSSSRAALAALLGGRVHAAGVHLYDRTGGEYNLAAVRDALRRRRAVMVNFASWELGLGVRRGNPLELRSIGDLARPGMRIVNREPGSGARLVLDQALAELKIASRRIAGYARELSGHLEVAAAIAAGEAEAGLTLRVAAEAFKLGFVPVREERYDLVILQRETDSPPVRAMLDALNSGSFAIEVSELCAYDTARMGQVIARFN